MRAFYRAEQTFGTELAPLLQQPREPPRDAVDLELAGHHGSVAEDAAEQRPLDLEHRPRARALEAQARHRPALPRLRDRIGDAAERGVAPSPGPRAAKRGRRHPLSRLPRRDRALPLPRGAGCDHADRPRDRPGADLALATPPRRGPLARDPARDPD